jgi:ferric-dicitrate binding protein FerR (iron transport regulator)
VKVLGTSFNISSYQNEEHQVIALAEGRVEIIHSDESTIITPGWITEINNSSNQVRSYEGNVSDKIAWTRDILLFKNASFKDVTEQLERWYGVKIEIKGQPGGEDMKFNGTFKDEYLENVLENLMVDRDMDYRIAGEKVFIYFN